GFTSPLITQSVVASTFQTINWTRAASLAISGAPPTGDATVAPASAMNVTRPLADRRTASHSNPTGNPGGTETQQPDVKTSTRPQSSSSTVYEEAVTIFTRPSTCTAPWTLRSLPHRQSP